VKNVFKESLVITAIFVGTKMNK